MRVPELEKAIKILTEYYGRGNRLEYVRNPIAWALYQTWKYFDRKEFEKHDQK